MAAHARAVGLTRVPTEELRRVLAAVYHGDLPCPLTVPDLARHGLQHRAEDFLGHLRALDRRGVEAVLVAVIAERQGGGAN